MKRYRVYFGLSKVNNEGVKTFKNLGYSDMFFCPENIAGVSLTAKAFMSAQGEQKEANTITIQEL